MEPHVRYCTTSDGASIAFATMGAGPVVLYLPSTHSFAARLRLSPFHQSLSSALAERFTLVHYDGRGMGLSARDRQEYDLESRLRDLEAVVETIGADRFALLGHLYGGFAAIAYAARHRERVSGLVLTDAMAVGERYFTETPQGRVNAALGAVTAEQWEYVSEAIATAALRNHPQDAPPTAVRVMGMLLRETWTPDAFLAHRQALREIDVTADLPSVMAPTLVISTNRTQERAEVFEFSRELASAVRGARLARVTSGWTGWEDRDYAMLVSFLGEHASPTDEAPPQPTREASAAQPTGLQTIVFTDIEANTELLQRLGDERWRALLREHEAIIRAALAQHGGAEIKTMGDAFMASFGSAARALECAVALQRTFAAEELTDQGVPLRIRIGINAGEPIAEADDLFGTAVTMAARIQSIAKGGEILVSDVVRQLVAGKNFLFHDRGETVLRGFEDPVRLYEVRWTV